MPEVKFLKIKKTEFVLGGQSKTQMFESLKAAFNKKELTPLEPGAMYCMRSKRSSGPRSSPPDVFIPESDSATWGSNLPDSPIMGAEVPQDRLTIFLVPVSAWSGGTTDPNAGH